MWCVAQVLGGALVSSVIGPSRVPGDSLISLVVGPGLEQLTAATTTATTTFQHHIQQATDF